MISTRIIIAGDHTIVRHVLVKLLSPAVADIVVENYVRKASETDPSAFSILSQRERETLQLMAEGNTTKQIALRLHISPKTMEGHRLGIMSKLNIDNVAQLTQCAIQ